MFFSFFIKNTFYRMRIYLVFNLYAISDNCCNVNLRHEVTTCKIACICQMYIVSLYACAMYKYRNARRDVGNRMNNVLLHGYHKYINFLKYNLCIFAMFVYFFSNKSIYYNSQLVLKEHSSII